MRKLGISFVALALALTGCTATTDAETTTSPKPTPTAVTVEEPATATVQQVASVIAAHDADFRETDEAAWDCRSAFIDAETDPIAELDATSCFANRVTSTMWAQITIRDLAALEVPAELVPLVNETVAMMELLAELDLSVCGEQFDVPDLGDEECNGAITSSEVYLGSIVGTLDKWRPYL